MIDRKENMNVWLKELGYDLTTLQVASEDASFRRYFRVKKDGKSYIVMDAPPEYEPCDQFVALATSLTSHHVNAPKIFAKNMIEGYLVISDFGDDLLLTLLNKKTVNDLYSDAMSAILHMQTDMPTKDIPIYTAQLLNTEMMLFIEWFVEKLLGLRLSEQQEVLWVQAKEALIKSAVEQPQTFVHRDFHSRNLIKTPNNKMGIIDFQDAVKGAMTYDLVSLLRDCYINWPEDDVERWLVEYYRQAVEQKIMGESFAQFKMWFNLMGVQRHLKAIGIFSRLKLRDNKQGYIKDIPRTLAYIEHISGVEPSLTGLNTIIHEMALVEKASVLVDA